MEKQINNIFQLPYEITYNIEAFLSYDNHCRHKFRLYYIQIDNFKNYLLHETDAFYVICKTKEEAVIKMYNLLKEKNVI